jgi:hypothetical protein
VSKPGRTSSWRSIKRYIAKLAAFFVATIIFGIIYSGTTQPILDMAFRGEIGWGSAISQAMIKALQYGTIRWPEFLINGFDALVQARPFTAFINYLFPLSVLFIANFYWTSFWTDLLDGREGEVFRYWVVALFTVVWMVFVFALMNGFMFVSGADVTFEAEQIKANVQEYGVADPMAKPHAPVNETAANSTGTSASSVPTNNTVETEQVGTTVLEKLFAVMP